MSKPRASERTTHELPQPYRLGSAWSRPRRWPRSRAWPGRPARPPRARRLPAPPVRLRADRQHRGQPGRRLHRAANGTLTLAAHYTTGGLGGQLTGSVVDHLASQGSLTYARITALLYAVNAGSNTVSVFAASGDPLSLRQVIRSGGTFPVSVAVHGNLVYVVNALNGGRCRDTGRLRPPGPHPGIGPAAAPQPERDAAVHQHAGPGRVLARRLAAHRHHQGQRQRHRRVQRRLCRHPVQHPSRTPSRTRCRSPSPSTRRVTW